MGHHHPRPRNVAPLRQRRRQPRRQISQAARRLFLFRSSFLDPPTLGSSQNWIWDNNGGVWARRTFAVGGDNNLGAIIDACNPCDPCDMNCDGVVDATDIESLINLLFNGATPCNFCTGDTNGDGKVNAEDIEGFIDCLFP